MSADHDQAEPDDEAEAEPEGTADYEDAVLTRMELVKSAMGFLGRAPAVLALYQEIPDVLQRQFESAHLQAVCAASDFLAATFRAAAPK